MTGATSRQETSFEPMDWKTGSRLTCNLSGGPESEPLHEGHHRKILATRGSAKVNFGCAGSTGRAAAWTRPKRAKNEARAACPQWVLSFASARVERPNADLIAGAHACRPCSPNVNREPLAMHERAHGKAAFFQSCDHLAAQLSPCAKHRGDPHVIDVRRIMASPAPAA